MKDGDAYRYYLAQVSVKWEDIEWVADIINELLHDKTLCLEEARNFVDSLYYGEKWEDFK